MWLEYTGIYWNILEYTELYLTIPDVPNFEKKWIVDLGIESCIYSTKHVQISVWNQESRHRAFPRMSKNNFRFMECCPTHLTERLFSSGKNRAGVAPSLLESATYFRQLANSIHDIVFWMSEMGEIDKKRYPWSSGKFLDKLKPGFIPKTVLFVQSSL